MDLLSKLFLRSGYHLEKWDHKTSCSRSASGPYGAGEDFTVRLPQAECLPVEYKVALQVWKIHDIINWI